MDKNKLAKARRSVKEFWDSEKTAVVGIAFTGAAAAAAIFYGAAKTNHNFIVEKGLEDEFNAWLTDDM